jgi:hypothetical protein
VHQYASTTSRRVIEPHARRILCAILFGFMTCAARAQGQPTTAMMEPVHGLVAFMSALRRGEQPTMFARRGSCIIENFAPYLFCGLQAVASWSAAFRAHAAADQLSELEAAFGVAQDFSQSGKRVYFSLPTAWTGLTNGTHFEEHGAWSFVLEQADDRWLIVGYGWGVTTHSAMPR